MWFQRLTGFPETSAQNVNEKLEIDGDQFFSKDKQKHFAFGRLAIPTLDELRLKCSEIGDYNGKIQVSELIADVQNLHCLPENANALFQAASQFNLLEMVGPHVTPEMGIDQYEFDKTQGPACAIACGAGTIYRNYFVEVNGQIGQTATNQIDCLDLIGNELNNEQLQLWNMQNGYALFEEKGLLALNKILAEMTTTKRESIKGKLKIGIQWDTEVTLSVNKHKVTQAYCSARPVSYCRPDSMYWESFSRIILEATYEATLCAAILNMEKNNSNKVFLTLVGGGAFGNDQDWILESLEKVLSKFKNAPLDVKVVSYGRSNSSLTRCIDNLRLN
jgi:hypothetical protein